MLLIGSMWYLGNKYILILVSLWVSMGRYLLQYSLIFHRIVARLRDSMLENCVWHVRSLICLSCMSVDLRTYHNIYKVFNCFIFYIYVLWLNRCSWHYCLFKNLFNFINLLLRQREEIPFLAHSPDACKSQNSIRIFHLCDRYRQWWWKLSKWDEFLFIFPYSHLV